MLHRLELAAARLDRAAFRLKTLPLPALSMGAFPRPPRRRDRSTRNRARRGAPSSATAAKPASPDARNGRRNGLVNTAPSIALFIRFQDRCVCYAHPPARDPQLTVGHALHHASARKRRAVANRSAAKMATTSVRGVPRCSRTIRCRRHGTCDEGSTQSPEAKKGRCASREDVAGSRKDARSLSRAEANAEEAQAQDEHRRPVGKEHDRGQQYSPEAAFAQDKVVQATHRPGGEERR